jgi:hypothetical protein
MATTAIKMEEIDLMRGNLLALVDYVYKNRFRMQQDDGRQLDNHLKYALTILSNMSNKLQVQLSEPCYSPSCHNTGASSPYRNGQSGQTVLYDQQGNTTIVNKDRLPRTGDGWEQQFDSTLLLNPPCYTIPPQNLTNISTIRKAAARQ